MAFVLGVGLFCLWLFVQKGFAQGLRFKTTAPLNSTQQLFGSSYVVCHPSYDWAKNSLGQNPCLVAAWLTGVCDGFGEVWSLSPSCVPYAAPLGNSLGPPSKCKCSSVTYNLISACAGCQGEPYLTWGNYASNCSTSNTTEGDILSSIPNDTRIPSWAYLLPSQNNHWYNAPLSKKTGRAPENQRLINPTGVFDYNPPKASCSGGPKDDSGGGGKGMKKTTIIGIAVGGAAGVIIIGTAAYVVRTRSRSAARKTPPTATNGLRTSAGFGAIAGRDTGDFVGSAGGVVQVPSAAHGVSTAVGMAGNRAPFAFGGAPVAAPVVRTFAESGFGVTENPNVFTSIGPGTGTAAAPRTRASISSARTYASRTATSPVTAASFYPPEVANATNAGSLSPTQSPSYLSDSAPRSPESASPGLSSPPAFPPTNPNPPYSDGNESQPNQGLPYYATYFTEAYETN